MSTTESPITIFDPVAVFAEEVDKHPSPAGNAARVLLDVQSQLQRILFQAPRIEEMEFRVLTPRKTKVAMQVHYRVQGKMWRRKLEIVIDGRQIEKARLDGKVYDTPLIGHQAALKIAAEVNR